MILLSGNLQKIIEGKGSSKLERQVLARTIDETFMEHPQRSLLCFPSSLNYQNIDCFTHKGLYELNAYHLRNLKVCVLNLGIILPVEKKKEKKSCIYGLFQRSKYMA